METIINQILETINKWHIDHNNPDGTFYMVQNNLHGEGPLHEEVSQEQAREFIKEALEENLPTVFYYQADEGDLWIEPFETYNKPDCQDILEKVTDNVYIILDL